MSNLWKTETKPLGIKCTLEVQDKFIDYILIRRPFVGTKKKHYKESEGNRKRENKVRRIIL